MAPSGHKSGEYNALRNLLTGKAMPEGPERVRLLDLVLIGLLAERKPEKEEEDIRSYLLDSLELLTDSLKLSWCALLYIENFEVTITAEAGERLHAKGVKTSRLDDVWEPLATARKHVCDMVTEGRKLPPFVPEGFKENLNGTGLFWGLVPLGLESETRRRAIAFLCKQELMQSTEEDLCNLLASAGGVIESRLRSSVEDFSLGEQLDRMVHERTAELTMALETQEMLVREVHHRVRNNMQILQSLLKFQERQSPEESVRIVFEECRSRVQTLSLAYEKLYSAGEFVDISLSEYLKTLTHSLLLKQGGGGSGERVNLEPSFSMGDFPVNLETAIAVGMIVTELIINSLRHAYPEGGSGILTIEMNEPDQEHMRLKVADDGAGMRTQPDLEKPDSMGMLLISAMLKQLGGRAYFETEKGTAFTIIFPKPSQKKLFSP